MRRVKQGTKINLSQSGLHKSWWPYTGRHYTFARRSNMVDGDSTYNKRHAQGHCKAKRIMFGQLVDYLPTPSPKETKRSKDFVNRTRTGLFVGYHIQPGCLWSGDYLVVDWEKLQSNPDATPGQCRRHRTSTIVNHDPGKAEFPLANYRAMQERLVKIPSVVESEKSTSAFPGQLDPDVDGEAAEQSAGESGDDLFGWVGGGDGEPKEDLRGRGEVHPDGRTVRKWAGSSRPPGIDSDVWHRLYTASEKKQLIREYEDYLKGVKRDMDAGVPADTSRAAAGKPTVRPESNYMLITADVLEQGGLGKA